MSYSYLLRPLSFFSWALSHTSSAIDVQPLPKEEVIVYEHQCMQMTVPDYPLSKGSLKIETKSHILHLSDWEEENALVAYQLIQKVIGVWKENGVTDYLIYAKESTSSNSFGYEVVPYPKNGWRFWEQFKVLWNIIFGGPSLSKSQRLRIANDFQQLEQTSSEISPEKEYINGIDFFCNPYVVESQRVFEGKKINVLYNYAPIGLGERKLHFLLVPKEHRLKFSDLTQEEYLETVQLSQKLIRFYKEKEFKTAYLFNKSGAQAGQSVPHWHEHVVFTASKTQEIFGKLTILKNMLIGSRRLSEQELQTRVASLKKELFEALQ